MTSRLRFLYGHLLLAVACGASASARAAIFDLSYSGRIVDNNGMPLTGPIDVTVRFFGSISGGDQLGESISYPGVATSDGILQLMISLNEGQQTAIFGDGTRRVYIEMEAAGKVYPRQSYAAVPMALRVPIDNNQLIFAPDTSELTIDHVEISQVRGLTSALANSAQAASGTASGYLSQTDWLRFDAKQALINENTSLNAATITTNGQSGLLLRSYGS